MDGGEEARGITIANLILHVPVFEALPAFRKAIGIGVEQNVDHAIRGLLQRGSKMSPEDSQTAEQFLLADPADPPILILLLGYYFRSRISRDDSARQAHRALLLKSIELIPRLLIRTPEIVLFEREDHDSYATAKELWQSHVASHPSDVRILSNAAGFFTLSDRRLSGELLRRARSQEPANSEWPRRLSRLYELEMMGKPASDQRDWAAMALAELEKAYRESDEQVYKYSLVTKLAKLSLISGVEDKAEGYSHDLLSKASEVPPGLAALGIHVGNIVLGRLALMGNDLVSAKKHIIDAARITGSPTLNSFGPDLTLAKGLLERGESQIVLDYFDLCSVFWQHSGRLDHWKADVRQGRMPDFGPRACV